jgi:folate-binding protein YgfZ
VRGDYIPAAYTDGVRTVLSSPAVGRRPRAFVRVAGPDAEAYLQRLVSNDVAALSPGDSCEALLLTSKARVVAPMRVFRRGADDFLLLTEPELGETLRAGLVRMRFAAKVEIELEEHESFLLLGAEDGGVPNDDYGVPAVEVLDSSPPEGVPELSDDELEALRIEAGTPRFGREIDERVLPAEAGLVERAVSLAKGCFPGQEPIARLHYRGHANRSLRVLRLEGGEPPARDEEILLGDKTVGRITSAVARDREVLALGYVRAEVPADAELRVGEAVARPLHWVSRERP